MKTYTAHARRWFYADEVFEVEAENREEAAEVAKSHAEFLVDAGFDDLWPDRLTLLSVRQKKEQSK